MTSNRRTLVLFLIEIRKSARQLIVVVLLWTAFLFLLSDRLLALLQTHIGGQLYFFSVAEPFLAHVRLSFFAALLALMPLMLHVLWKALAAPFRMEQRLCRSFVASTSILFYVGALFCYLVTLPYGIQFLLGFGSETLIATIAISRFVNFVSLFVLAFGLVFETPVFMIFCATTGLVSAQGFARHRRYAILAIAVLAAVLTPTPDVVNMALMGGPLYFLYELGIVLIRVFRLERGAGQSDSTF